MYQQLHEVIINATKLLFYCLCLVFHTKQCSVNWSRLMLARYGKLFRLFIGGHSHFSEGGGRENFNLMQIHHFTKKNPTLQLASRVLSLFIWERKAVKKLNCESGTSIFKVWNKMLQNWDKIMHNLWHNIWGRVSFVLFHIAAHNFTIITKTTIRTFYRTTRSRKTVCHLSWYRPLSKSTIYICLTSLTRAKPKEKWNFPLNFRTMRKLSDLYSRIFQTQSSGCVSGLDHIRNFTNLKILNI